MTYAGELSPQQTHLGGSAVLDTCIYFEESSVATQQLKFSWVQLAWPITWCSFWERWLMLVSKARQKMTKRRQKATLWKDTHLNKIRPLSHCLVSRQLVVGGDKDFPAATSLSRAVATNLTASWIWDDSSSWSNCIPMAPVWQSTFII